MAKWLHEVNIKQFLEDDRSIKAAKEAIDKELLKVPEAVRFEWPFAEWDVTSHEAALEEDLDMFDEALDSLYDWADDNRVWLGI